MINCVRDDKKTVVSALTSFNYTGAVSGIPVYLNIGEVEAVVQLKAGGGDAG